jgi:hypothetical protein
LKVDEPGSLTRPTPFCICMFTFTPACGGGSGAELPMVSTGPAFAKLT